DVDDGPATRLEQMRDAVLATEIHALRVHGLDAVPRVGLGDEYRVVVGGHDAGVVVEHVDMAVTVFGRGVHRLHAVRVADVRLKEESTPTPARGLLPRLASNVGDAHARAFGREQDRGLAAYAAGRAGDNRNLAV